MKVPMQEQDAGASEREIERSEIERSKIERSEMEKRDGAERWS